MSAVMRLPADHDRRIALLPDDAEARELVRVAVEHAERCIAAALVEMTRAAR